MAQVVSLLKSLWDRYWKRRDELEDLRRGKRIDLLERQLSRFYWPLYFHLQKDNAVWSRLRDRALGKDDLREQVARQIEKDFILPNHEETVQVIESNIHLTGANEELLRQLLAYIRHVAVYNAMRSSGDYTHDPISLGEPWPATGRSY